MKKLGVRSTPGDGDDVAVIERSGSRLATTCPGMLPPVTPLDSRLSGGSGKNTPVKLANMPSLSIEPWCHRRDPAASLKILANAQGAGSQYSGFPKLRVRLTGVTQVQSG